jgi:transcriptional regulator with XRE-family HTH domain
LPENLASQLIDLGARCARLRIAQKVSQSEASIRAGISRTTACQIEKGSPRIAVGQILRYVDAISPGKTIAQLATELDPSVVSLSFSEQRKRARKLTEHERKEIDF